MIFVIEIKLVLLVSSLIAGADDGASQRVVALRLTQMDHHLVFETSLSPGRHPLAEILPHVNGIQGFIYSTESLTNTEVASHLRIFQMKAEIPEESIGNGKGARRVSVRNARIDHTNVLHAFL